VVLADNDPILYGNPTEAQTNATFSTNYLKNSAYYKIGYNEQRGISNWVAWHLQSEDLGGTPRQDDFRPDTDLPAGYYQVQNSSYTGTNFDRGHNCPSGDRTSTVAANSSTFLMTNMIPQAPNLNQGPWDELEGFTRTTLVGGNKEAYILMGSFGTGGFNSAGTYVTTIDAGRVTVPEKIWKVILVLPKGNNDTTRIDTTATVLVVNMPNNNALYSTSGAGRDAWRNYITTVASLETEANASGNYTLDLFKRIPAAIRTYLKAKRYQ
ncbi:MAG: DNA/RNA non-specific endonuclease, partial [Chitinophagaceae bacterium]